MRRLVFGIVVLAVVAAIAIWRAHVHQAPLEQVFAASRKVTVWSSNAQVREPLVYATFGDRFDVLERSGDSVQVRTTKGVEGWVASRDLLSADLWQRTEDLAAAARKMPVQAAGHTKVLTNLRLDPGRDAVRIFQLPRDTPVDLLQRRVVDVPVSGANQGEEDAGEPATTKKEDWLLVLAHAKDQGDFAGWVVGRFVAMDLPDPLPDYTSSAGMRVAGWMELNHVVAAGQPHAQYLVFGTRGPEGDVCDFSTLRVYTWGIKRARYETAFVDSNFCGLMPVEVTPATQPGGDANFHFATIGKSGKEDRAYRMHQTIVRRTDENRGKRPAKKKK